MSVLGLPRQRRKQGTVSDDIASAFAKVEAKNQTVSLTVEEALAELGLNAEEGISPEHIVPMILEGKNPPFVSNYLNDF